MHIAAYVNPLTVSRVETGVSKHVRNMVLELSRRPDVKLGLISPRREWDTAMRRDGEHPFRGLPVTLLPTRRSWLEKAWSLTGFPRVDRWCAGAEWVYAPMEAYVPAAKARMAVTVHAMYWFEPDLPFYSTFHTDRLLWRLKLGPVFRRDDVLLLVVSAYLKGRLVDLFGIRPERIAVVGNGVEDIYYRLGGSPAAATAPSPRYALVVGGLTQFKGGEATLRVAKALRDRGSDLEIWIAGVSESNLAAAATAHPNVKHLGYRGIDTGLPELMRGATALLFVSLCDTFGIPAAEAMAIGTPVVASRNGGLPEVVGSGGLLVDSAQPDEVADHLIRLADDPAARAKLIARGKQRSLDHTWAKCAERLCATLARGGPEA
jgi:glycosyltransferase involved in cell wall biosynthesis